MVLWLLTVAWMLPFLGDSQPMSFRFVPDIDISLPDAPPGACKQDATLIASALKNGSLWAMRMWDATAQGSSGALFGSTWQLGNFDECLLIRKPIRTQYCVLLMQSNITTIRPLEEDSAWNYIQETIRDRRYLRRDIHHPAICVPASCTFQDLQVAITEQMKQYSDEHTPLTAAVIPDLCTNNLDSPEWTANEICFMAFIGIITLATIAGTIVAYSALPSCNRFMRVLLCFSFPQNWLRLIEIEPADRTHPFAILHGIKVLSMAMVLFGHRSGVPIGAAVANYQYVEEIQKEAHTMLLMQGDLIVDTFFFMSGVLATNMLLHLNNDKRVSPVTALIARLIRIAPVYYLLVWFQASVGHRIGSGPLWNYVQKLETENCQNYWWASILFIHNFLPATKLCHIHSWYLACDVHFFLLALLLVRILSTKPMFGKVILSALIIFTPLLPAYAVYSGSLDPLVLFYDAFHSNPRADPSFGTIYIASHMRVTVYVIGVAVGYFLHKKETSKNILSKLYIFGGLGISAVLLGAPMIVGGMYYSETPPGQVFSTVYAALRRPAWALGLTVLLLIHRFLPKNNISNALSHPVAAVFSKLTYTMYLVHFPLILYNWAKTRSPNSVSMFNMYSGGLGDLVLTAAFSAIIFVSVEIPVKRIFREVIHSKNLKDAKLHPNKMIAETVKF